MKNIFQIRKSISLVALLSFAAVAPSRASDDNGHSAETSPGADLEARQAAREAKKRADAEAESAKKGKEREERAAKFAKAAADEQARLKLAGSILKELGELKQTDPTKYKATLDKLVADHKIASVNWAGVGKSAEENKLALGMSVLGPLFLWVGLEGGHETPFTPFGVAAAVFGTSFFAGAVFKNSAWSEGPGNVDESLKRMSESDLQKAARTVLSFYGPSLGMNAQRQTKVADQLVTKLNLNRLKGKPVGDLSKDLPSLLSASEKAKLPRLQAAVMEFNSRLGEVQQ